MIARKIVLDNGVRLVMSRMQEMRSVSIGIWVGIGGRYEEDIESGISHFLEHMLFKGTKTKTAAQISQLIEGVGGAMNAFTTEECTCFYVKVMGKHFKQALSVMADMFQNPAFHPKDVERERGVILDELRMGVDVPSQYVYDRLRKIMWPKHPLGRMLIGTEKSISRLKRENLLGFKDANYTAKNIVVSVAGHINEKEVENEVRRKFSFLKPKDLPKHSHVTQEQSKPSFDFVKRKTEQTHFCLGIRAYPRNHPRRFALRILNAILGENMSSRLFQEIREKLGLSYDISSSVDRFADTGMVLISGGTEDSKISNVIEATLKELIKLKKKEVTHSELHLAKEYCLGQASLSLEKTSNQMIYLGESELLSNKMMRVDEIFRQLRSVTADDIKSAARELFMDSGLNLAIIGQGKHAFKIQKTLNLN